MGSILKSILMSMEIVGGGPREGFPGGGGLSGAPPHTPCITECVYRITYLVSIERTDVQQSCLEGRINGSNIRRRSTRTFYYFFNNHVRNIHA